MRNYQSYSAQDLELFQATAFHLRSQNNSDSYKKNSSRSQNLKPSCLRNVKSVQRLYPKPQLNMMIAESLMKKSCLKSELGQKIRIQQRDKNVEKHKNFMNVISKNNLSDKLYKFVYGEVSSKKGDDDSSQTQTPSSQFKSCKQTQSVYQVDKRVNMSKPVVRGNFLMEESSAFQNFPFSKVKRSINKSARKSSSDKVQLSQNCKKQIQNSNAIQIKNTKNTSQDLSQQQVVVRQQAHMWQTYADKWQDHKYDQKVNEIQDKPQSNIGINVLGIQKLDWNDTIKFNQKKSNTDIDKLFIDNMQSTAPNNNTENNISICSQEQFQEKTKNLTKRISEFIVCDQDIGNQIQNTGNRQQPCNQIWKKTQFLYKNSQNISQVYSQIDNISQNSKANFQSSSSFNSNEKAFVPVFEIKLSDLQYIQRPESTYLTQRNIQPKLVSDLMNLETKNSKPEGKSYNMEEFRIQDKIGKNIEVLEKNIQELSDTISNLCFIKDSRQITKKEKKLTLTKCIDEEFRQIKAQYLQSSQLNQKTQYQTQTFNNKNQQIPDQTEYNKDGSNEQQLNIDENKKDQFVQTTTQLNQFLPEKQIKEGENSLLSNRNVVTKEFDYQQTLNQSSQCPNHTEKQSDNALLGSLQVIDTAHEDSNLGHSLHRFYQKQQFILELSPQKNQQDTNQDHHNTNTKTYPEHLFCESKHVHFLDLHDQQPNISNQTVSKANHEASPQSDNENIPQENIQKNQHKTNLNKVQNIIPHQKFLGVKTFQNSRSKSQFQKVKQPLNNYYQHERRLSVGKRTGIECQQSKSFESRKLNYQMHRAFQNKTFSKKYTTLSIDKTKQKVIELPYMERHISRKLGGQDMQIPKYIRSKVYYLKV